MRKCFHILPVLFFALCNYMNLAAQETDAVKKAQTANQLKADEKKINKHVADFLVEATDARMMDRKEGQLATKLGTSSAIRGYGQLMITDQTQMLAQIKTLASSRNITVPQSISDDKKDALKKLSEKTGEDFDKKFIKMMIVDHERDIKSFEKAAQWQDSVISKFATDHLPMLYKHLDSLKTIQNDN